MMHLIYLDESGDGGQSGSPTAHYIVAGLAVHAHEWHRAMDVLRGFREKAQATHGLDSKVEMHAAEFLGAAHSHRGLGRIERLGLARDYLALIGDSRCFRTFGWWITKAGPDPVDSVSRAVLDSLDGWALEGSLPGPPDRSPRYLLIHDTMGKRPMAWQEPGFPHRIERAFSEDSAQSLLLQAADFIAYAVRQHLRPNSFLAGRGGRSLIKRLEGTSLGFREVVRN